MNYVLLRTPAFVRPYLEYILTNGIYERNGTLKRFIRDVLDTFPDDKFPALALACTPKEKGQKAKLVGYILIEARPGSYCHFFVDRGYRRQGIGSNLVKQARRVTGDKLIRGHYGFEGYEKFYAKNFIYDTEFPYSLNASRVSEIGVKLIKKEQDRLRRLTKKLMRNIA